MAESISRIFLAISLAGALAAQSYTTVPVVMNGAPVPGTSAVFTGFGDVETDGSWILFYALDDRLVSGYYLWDGVGITTIVDGTTPVPITGGTFYGFEEAAVGGGAVAFVARDDNQDFGVFTWSGGVLSRVAHETTVLPNGLFADEFSGVTMQGGDALFRGFEYGPSSGVYRALGGIVTVVADTVSPVAGTDFTSVGQPVVDGPRVAFWGITASGSGAYNVLDGATLSTLIDDSTPVPGQGCPVTGKEFGYSGDNLTIFFYDSCGEGFWGTNGAGTDFFTIVDVYATLVPGESFTFEAVGTPIADRGNFTFSTFESFSSLAIYLSFGGGHLKSVMRESDPNPGAPGETLGWPLDHDAASDSVVFSAAGLGVPTTGVYLATLDPKPCGDCDLGGAVDILDALRAAQLSLSGGDTLFRDSQAFWACNVAGPQHPDPAAAISILDALRIAQHGVGLVPVLTCP